MFNEIRQLDDALLLNQISDLSVRCAIMPVGYALAPLINVIPLANHLFG